jgi:hypothetical protein
MYGISVKIKISRGTVARKKLNATAEALVVMAPFTIPRKKYRTTSITGTPWRLGTVKYFNLRRNKAAALLKRFMDALYFLKGFTIP